jgi:hypothetical protein
MSEANDISQTSSSSRPHREDRKHITFSARTVVFIVILIVFCGLSFIGGISFQKHHGTSTTAATNLTSGAPSGTSSGGFGGGGFGGTHRSGGFGTVTAISSSSITIQNSRTGDSTTYSISSSTTITDNGQTVTTSAIQMGDTVVITVASTGSTTATAIIVNPSFGGGGSASGSSSQTPNQAE